MKKLQGEMQGRFTGLNETRRNWKKSRSILFYFKNRTQWRSEGFQRPGARFNYTASPYYTHVVA